MNHAFYTSFGVLTCAFAGLEADIREIISGIAFGDKRTTAAAFLDSSQLGDNLASFRKLGREHWDYDESIKKICKRVEKIRQQRNLFIHGLWKPGNYGEKGGHAFVSDLNSKYEESPTGRHWTHGHQTGYTAENFADLLKEISSIQRDIAKLRDRLEKDEDLEFGLIGSTTIGQSVTMKIEEDGSLSSVEADDKS